jgi:hypothetical protein
MKRLPFIAILAVLAIQYTFGASLEDEGREMFRVLHEQQRYPMPVSYPVYHLGPTPDMPTACAKFAACYARGHIWIVSPLVVADERERLVSLLHESVHHLQWEKRGDAKNCQQNYDREVEAYKAQQVYISENYRQYIRVHIPVCPPEQGGPSE